LVSSQSIAPFVVRDWYFFVSYFELFAHGLAHLLGPSYFLHSTNTIPLHDSSIAQ